MLYKNIQNVPVKVSIFVLLMKLSKMKICLIRNVIKNYKYEMVLLLYNSTYHNFIQFYLIYLHIKLQF